MIKLNDSELKLQLDKVLNDLAQINGIDGSLIVDGNGEVLSHYLLHKVDIELFGPMAHVITSSSKRLINFANNGEIERVLVESKYGKALFLHLGNVHFIVLMKNKANVGMVMISSKKASQKIMDLTHDLTPIDLEEQVAEPAAEIEIEQTGESSTEMESNELSSEPSVEAGTSEPSAEVEATEISGEQSEAETSEPSGEQTAEVEAKVSKSSMEETPEIILESEEQQIEAESSKEAEFQTESESELIKETKIEEKPELTIELPTEEKPKPVIPVIRPPISFPKLAKVVEVPEDENERADLILKIYESILLAMSIGASKIMGVAPARGLTRKFLPTEECKKLLNGVDVKNNSTIDFDKIRENAEKIPASEREESLKDNFGKIVTIVTENYGKVMGYAAFRGMVRPEFKIINESYGSVIEEMGIKDKLHPELLDLFQN